MQVNGGVQLYKSAFSFVCALDAFGQGYRGGTVRGSLISTNVFSSIFLSAVTSFWSLRLDLLYGGPFL